MKNDVDRRTFLRCAGCAALAALTGCAGARPHGAKGDNVTPPPNPRRPEDLSSCGVDCAACDVYKATVHGDDEARARAVKVWSKTAQQHWGMETLDPAVLDCAGCRVSEVMHHGHGRCPIRRCARERGLVSCGLCAEWRDCPRLRGVFADEPDARPNLDAIARGAEGGTADKRR